MVVKNLLSLIVPLMLIYCTLRHFDWLMSPKRLKRIHRLSSRQSWCISSDSVAYSAGGGGGGDGIPANLYRNSIFEFFTRNAHKGEVSGQ